MPLMLKALAHSNLKSNHHVNPYTGNFCNLMVNEYLDLKKVLSSNFHLMRFMDLCLFSKPTRIFTFSNRVNQT
jgi:hypothetical protein